MACAARWPCCSPPTPRRCPTPLGRPECSTSCCAWQTACRRCAALAVGSVHLLQNCLMPHSCAWACSGCLVPPSAAGFLPFKPLGVAGSLPAVGDGCGAGRLCQAVGRAPGQEHVAVVSWRGCSQHVWLVRLLLVRVCFATSSQQPPGVQHKMGPAVVGCFRRQFTCALHALAPPQRAGCVRQGSPP